MVIITPNILLSISFFHEKDLTKTLHRFLWKKKNSYEYAYYQSGSRKDGSNDGFTTYPKTLQEGDNSALEYTIQQVLDNSDEINYVAYS